MLTENTIAVIGAAIMLTGVFGLTAMVLYGPRWTDPRDPRIFSPRRLKALFWGAFIIGTVIDIIVGITKASE